MARARLERPTPTHLAPDVRGAYGGRRFRLLGGHHVCADHGARWNEWAVELEDGRRCWLAERGDGLVWLEETNANVEALASARLGAVVDGFVVFERGQARRSAAWGRPPPAARHFEYVEAAGPRGALATTEVDPRGRRAHFTGRSVRARALALPAAAGSPLFFWEAPSTLPPGAARPFAVGERITLGGRALQVVGLLLRESGGERWCEALATWGRSGLAWIAQERGHKARSFMHVPPPLVGRRSGQRSLEGVAYRRHARMTVSTVSAEGLFPFEVQPGRDGRVTEYRGPGGRRLVSEQTESEIVWLAAGAAQPLGTTAGED